MNLEALSAKLDAVTQGVVLLEGTRALPETDRPAVMRLAVMLAKQHPRLVFRSGNADGADETFAAGVCSVDPARMEYVLPATGHRRAARDPRARSVSLDDCSAEQIVRLSELTNRATPANKRLIDRYVQGHRVGRGGHQAKYLLRDTLKVAGAVELDLAPAVLGMFYVNPDNPEGGGTGHTIRACQVLQVPVMTQADWLRFVCNKARRR